MQIESNDNKRDGRTDRRHVRPFVVGGDVKESAASTGRHLILSAAFNALHPRPLAKFRERIMWRIKIGTTAVSFDGSLPMSRRMVMNSPGPCPASPSTQLITSAALMTDGPSICRVAAMRIIDGGSFLSFTGRRTSR